MILQKIVEEKKGELKSVEKLDFSSLTSSERNFKKCIKGKNNIIAEIKKRSPSENHLTSADVTTLAKIYDKYANAISIVTDKNFFGGYIEDIKQIKKVTSLPILRKDFIIDEFQILESRYHGADAILLIAAILTKKQINTFIDSAKKYNMDCLVEIHTKQELDKVLKTKAEIIGINNRNLNNFEIDLKITKKIAKLIPQNKIVVSESGFNNFKEIQSVNTNAVLIGTSLLKSSNTQETLSLLRKPKIKICGITNLEDANTAIDYGADFLGFNFYKKSSRYITPDKAKEIISLLPNSISTVGIFINESKGKIHETADFVGLDFLQFHGEESAEFCSSFSLPVIKAFRIDKASPNIENYKVFAYLFDAFDKNLYGGTGKSFDLNLIKNIQNKVFLSGGLNNENVRKAMELIDPYCVDVCSGVEKERGVKDKQKIKEFIQKVK